MQNPIKKPQLAVDLPPPPRIEAAAAEQIRIESRQDRVVMDRLVSDMQALGPSDLKIRLK